MTQPLLDYLSSHAEDYPHPPINEQVIEDLRALDTLRNQLIHVKKTVVSVDTPFLKYLAWLDPLGLKFPIYDDFIPMHFGWHAAMGSRRKEKDEEEEGVDVGFTRHPHLQWEKASMVFNVGAWYSVLGCACTLDSEMEIKQACEYFQRAAGVFEYLKDQVTMNVFEEGIDFQPKCGSIFIHLMLAQSTETTWLMALTKGTLKDSSLSKLAAEISAAYFKLAMNVESFPEKSHSPILQVFN
ncbi:pH-response regulator protein palA/rim20 [Coelomomyces lativittatus]|nr:pH-response regulator protein palA/rim20 [Coelomomyces lativittatus]